MTEQIILKDCIGRELRIGDTIVHYYMSLCQLKYEKLIIYESGVTKNKNILVPYIKATVNGKKGFGVYSILNMENVVLIKHKPIKGQMPEFDDDYICME